MNTSSGGAGPGASSPWADYCERHARTAASDFARSCALYIAKNKCENVSHRDFMMKFIEAFSDHFDTEYQRRRAQNKVTNRSNYYASHGWLKLVAFHFCSRLATELFWRKRATTRKTRQRPTISRSTVGCPSRDCARATRSSASSTRTRWS